MRRLRVFIITLISGLCLIVAGKESAGKIALLAGLPEIAVGLLDNPETRGVALYQTERFAEADAAFARAGRVATYNRGLSLAATGQYPLALAYFDAVLFATPEDRAALQNRAIIAGLIDPLIGKTNTRGRIEAMVTDEDDALAAEDALRNLADQRSVRKPVDARSLVASEGWLETLNDAPGEYLKALLLAEFKRRAVLGNVKRGGALEW